MGTFVLFGFEVCFVHWAVECCVEKHSVLGKQMQLDGFGVWSLFDVFLGEGGKAVVC